MTENLALGLDFGGTKVDIGLGDSSGHVVERVRLPVSQYPDAETIVKEAIRAGKDMIGGHNIMGVGVSTMGITYEDRVDLAPNVPGWSHLRLPPLFRKAFPSLPLAIENDVKAACLAERRWGVLRAFPDSAYLNLGTGVEIAVSIGGELWKGVHGASGEIAYAWEYRQAGYADGHAPFEERYGGGALDARVHRQFPEFGGLVDACRQRDRADVEAYLTEVFEHLAHQVGQALLILDVEAVAVGGGMAQQWAWIEPVFVREWAQHLPYPPKLLRSAFAENAGLMGAFALAWTEVGR